MVCEMVGANREGAAAVLSRAETHTKKGKQQPPGDTVLDSFSNVAKQLTSPTLEGLWQQLNLNVSLLHQSGTSAATCPSSAQSHTPVVPNI